MLSTAPVPRIFVSYASADGRAFALALRERIIAAGFAVWQDLADMEGGRDWWEQIAALLRRKEVEHLVLVLTPKAVESEVVRREWRLARQEGVRVTPVVDAALRPDFGKLPRALARAHTLDPAIDEQWRQLLRILESPSGQPRVPFLAPEVPPGFVARPEEYARLKAALIDGGGEAVAITAALRGAGGFGKTTLAAKLAHDDDIGEAFFHGILWTTLGENPGDVTGRLNTLTRALDPLAPAETDRELAVARWREVLAERHCLIVVDDVWHAADLDPFLAGGPGCARLVTTRDEAVLPRERVARVPVDAMRPGEAAEMLTRGLDPAVTHPLAARFNALATRLGEWPLLLNLAHGRIAVRVGAGHSLDDALSAVEAAWRAKGVGAFDARSPRQRNEAAAASLDLSIGALAEGEGPEAAMRLEELGVFAEDQDVPFWLVTALWERAGGLDVLDGEDLLLRLRALSLLERYDAPRATFRLHDVVRARLRERLGPSRLRALDAQLAEVIAAKAAGSWQRLVPEPYALAYLPMHLVGGGDAEGLEALLCDAGWIEARLASGIASGEGAAGLVGCYDAFATGAVSRRVGRVLAVTGHDLAVDGPSQLIPQLLGGVIADRETEAARANWQAALRCPAIAPVRPTLVPHHEMVRIRAVSAIKSIAFSPDGTRLVTGSASMTAQLWDLASATETTRFNGHGLWVTSVVFSPDGARLATGSHDRSARLWDIITGEEIARFEGHEEWVTSVAISPDGMRLATGSSDGTARLWDLASAKPIARFEGHSDRVSSVAFSPDGKRLATGSDDRTTKLWDLTGKPIACLEGHTGWVRSVAFSPDGSRLVTGSADSTVRHWDLATGREIARLVGHEGAVWSVVFSPEGGRVASGSEDRTVRLWDTASTKPIARFEGHGDRVTSVAFLPDGTHVATGSDDGAARLWDLATATSTRAKGHEKSITSFAFSSEGTCLATGSEDGTARLWDPATGEQIARFEGHGGRVHGVALSPDGACLATGSDDRIARVWDIATGRMIAEFGGHEDSVANVAFSPDGAYLATGCWSGARLWDLTVRKEVARLECLEDAVPSVAFSLDGATFATATDDRAVRLWDLATCREITSLTGHGTAQGMVAFSPDVARLAIASWDWTARIWDIGTGNKIAQLDGHEGGVSSVAFSPDGTRLATGSWDRTARLWDVSTGTEIARFRFPVPVTQIAVCPSGMCLTVAAGAGVPHVLTVFDRSSDDRGQDDSTVDRLKGS